MMFNGLHYNSISTWLKNRYGCKVVKLAIDGGFTCPNRDGTKGTGGCSFCAEGSGRFAGSIEDQISGLSRKWNIAGSNVKYIAYFQSHTNTYAPAGELRKMWDEALSHENVTGLAIATRPDCIGPEILELLSEYNERTLLWVELGLQTANDSTAEAFNRCWKTSEFEQAAYNLSKRGIKHVTHLILGLPGEDKEQMLASAKYAASFDPFGLKIHMLHIMEGTAMGEQYKAAPFPLPDMNEYVSTVCDIIEHLPADITIHRLTGDAPGDILIAPEWTRNKHLVLNAIQQEFARRGTYQGISVHLI